MVAERDVAETVACATASATIAATAGSGAAAPGRFRISASASSSSPRLGVDREHRVRELLAVLARRDHEAGVARAGDRDLVVVREVRVARDDHPDAGVDTVDDLAEARVVGRDSRCPVSRRPRARAG